MIQGYQEGTLTPSIRNVNTEMHEVRWIPDRELTLTKVPNTQITCRLCRGSRFVISKSMYGNFGTQEICPNCDGTAMQISDHIDTLWGRNR